MILWDKRLWHFKLGFRFNTGGLENRFECTLYFFGYKIEFFSFHNMFRKGKSCIIAKFHRTDLVICSHYRAGKTLSCSQINIVYMILSDLICTHAY